MFAWFPSPESSGRQNMSSQLLSEGTLLGTNSTLPARAVFQFAIPCWMVLIIAALNAGLSPPDIGIWYVIRPCGQRKNFGSVAISTAPTILELRRSAPHIGLWRAGGDEAGIVMELPSAGESSASLDRLAITSEHLRESVSGEDQL